MYLAIPAALSGNDTGHDVGLDAGLVHFVHNRLNCSQVKDALGLDVLGAGVHLLAELVDLQEQRLIDRRDGGALVEPWRFLEVVAAAVLAALSIWVSIRRIPTESRS